MCRPRDAGIIACRRLVDDISRQGGSPESSAVVAVDGVGSAATSAATPSRPADRRGDRPAGSAPSSAAASALTAALARTPQHAMAGAAAQAIARRSAGSVLATLNPIRPAAASQHRTAGASGPSSTAAAPAATAAGSRLRPGLATLDEVYHGRCRTAHEALALARRSEASIREAVGHYSAAKYSHADDPDDDGVPASQPQAPQDSAAPDSDADMSPVELHKRPRPAPARRLPTDSFR